MSAHNAPGSSPPDQRYNADCVAAPELEPRRAITAVLQIHGKRVYDGDGYGWAICVEDRQHWPCVTVQALLREGFGSE